MKYHKQLQYFENYTVYDTNIDDKNIGCTPPTSNHGSSGNEHSHDCCPKGQGKNSAGICSTCPGGYYSNDYDTACKRCSGLYQTISSDRKTCTTYSCPSGYTHKSSDITRCRESDSEYYKRYYDEIHNAVTKCVIRDNDQDKTLRYSHGDYHLHRPGWVQGDRTDVYEWGVRDFSQNSDITDNARTDKSFGIEVPNKIQNGSEQADCGFKFYDTKNFAGDISWHWLEDVTDSLLYEWKSAEDSQSSVKVYIRNDGVIQPIETDADADTD
tara:strand:- start:104 stop:910 length:807 start_codon:yes stop_codon:yes gene_type:complete